MENSTLYKQFHQIAVLEGISFILLMFIAMPVKYMLGNPLLVKYVGWAHGLLFVLYMIWLLRAKIEYDWSFKKSAIAVVAALLPFGPFLLKKYL
jgi:integral membrane protein